MSVFHVVMTSPAYDYPCIHCIAHASGIVVHLVGSFIPFHYSLALVAAFWFEISFSQYLELTSEALCLVYQY